VMQVGFIVYCFHGRDNILYAEYCSNCYRVTVMCITALPVNMIPWLTLLT